MADFSPYLYGRKYQVSLQAPGQATSLTFGNIKDDDSALRVAFDLEKKSASAPNKGSISIFNLNAKTRAAITQGWFVQLRVGYVGLVETVFVGRVGVVNHQKQGAEMVTSLACTEGFSALMETTFSKSYPKGTPLYTILTDVARTMDVPVNVVRNLPAHVYSGGISLNGTCRDCLDILLRPLKVEAHISNGKLNILPLDLPFGQKAIVVSQETGMVSTPTVDKRSLMVEALLITSLCTPGQLIQVKTTQAVQSGFFKIRECKIEGDSHDAKWNVSLTCARLTDYTIKVVSATGLNFEGATVGLL